MNKGIIVQFMGFASTVSGREYVFTVRETEVEPREFTLTIKNEAFNAHRVRFQDAPDVCSLKLRRELASHANHPPENHFQITDIELEDYRSSHSSRAAKSLYGRRPTEEF
jgi:hypothetical protein